MFEYEDELIAGIIEGSDTAFRVAISQYQVSMLYLATSLVGQKIADEVVQEAWFSSLKAINKFEKRSSLKMKFPENMAASNCRQRGGNETQDEAIDALVAQLSSRQH